MLRYTRDVSRSKICYLPFPSSWGYSCIGRSYARICRQSHLSYLESGHLASSELWNSLGLGSMLRNAQAFSDHLINFWCTRPTFVFWFLELLPSKCRFWRMSHKFDIDFSCGRPQFRRGLGIGTCSYRTHAIPQAIRDEQACYRSQWSVLPRRLIVWVVEAQEWETDD